MYKEFIKKEYERLFHTGKRTEKGVSCANQCDVWYSHPNCSSQCRCLFEIGHTGTHKAWLGGNKYEFF